MVTYNGDFFDWPYVENRALAHGMDMEALVGFRKNSQGEYWSTHTLHLDCYRWVKRDSYLPAGSQGLKAVTSVKLGYDPLELDPELMTPLAGSDPQTLANYSVSDAVATFYLYMKYVQPFIFSLCTIIPLGPDDVLRKGTGTLCETLLMAEAYRANVIMPNKHADGKEKFYAGHLIESETYIGGHVEALEAGVFRSDIEYRFRVDPGTVQTLIDDLDRALTFSLQAEGHIEDLTLVTNYEAVRAEIKGRLEGLRDTPVRSDRPLIYHLDVASMYPNIILTNRLQPTAMVDESACAMCDHNRPGKTCQRPMVWSWRGELYTAKRNEYRMLKSQLEAEQFPLSKRALNGAEKTTQVPYHGLPEAEQRALLQKRLAEYSQKVYRRVRKTEVVQRTSIVCQKEHAFYIDTVRAFRDRRYDYKDAQKGAKRRLEEAVAQSDAVRVEESKKLVVLYESLQLAHKCILNSFYGYVMRKGARWYSMEMAGIVCATGSSIIQLARGLVERIGRPLELDTDGIWAMLPWDFPQGYTFTLSNGKKHAFDYPCVMLNHLVHDRFTNDQYQTLVDAGSRAYRQSAENSIFFEIDGPYRAMIIPSSTEEGKLLKKRYAVFNEDGSLAELKGFEVKRRGELKFLKVFQTQIFKVYLEGATLAECYGRVAEVADYWLDILHGRGTALEDHDLVDLISENRSMSKSLEEYGEQKSTSISTAKRLAEFLGGAMVKDKGLACKFIISAKPAGLPVTSRAIPLAIFSAEEPVRKHYLRKWLRDPHLQDLSLRSIVDWAYYTERLGSMVQKLIVIPAALQAVPNPVGRVAPPDWLKRRAGMRPADGAVPTGLELNQPKLQTRITEMFAKQVGPRDLEDLFLRKGHVAEAAGAPEGGEPPQDAPAAAAAPAAASVDPLLPETDYATWIAQAKGHWQGLRQKLAAPQLPAGRAPSAARTAFGRLAEGDRELISRTPWQIVQLQATELPGEFRVWAVLAGSPHARAFRLRMQRQLYLHLSCALEDVIAAEGWAGGAPPLLSRVYRKLPSGEDAEFLYEAVLDEQMFQQEYYKLAAITTVPQLLAVYEAEVPLDFKAVLALGCCAQLTPQVRRLREAGSTFMPGDFGFCTTRDVPYLTGDKVQWVVVIQFGADTRGVVVVGCAGRYRVLLADPGMRRQLPPNLKTLLPPASKEADAVFSVQPDAVTVEADMHADWAGVQRAVQRTITELVDSRAGPVIVLSHAATQSGRTLHVGDLPVVQVPDLVAPEAFPALDWQRSVARHAFGLVQALGPWLQHRLSLARYSHVPLGNLATEGSEYTGVSDVFMGRTLQRAGYLLWWFSGRDAPAADGGAGAFETVEAAPQISASGLYRTVCVEAELTGLAINAVMEHASISAEEAVGSSITVAEGGVGLLGGPPHHALFGLLKKLLSGWLRDVMQNGQAHAEQLAAGLHRWIVGEGRLHSPLLARRLQSLLNRTLTLLVARLHTYGCLVVHADAGRIVFKTSRRDHSAAQALLEWVGKELKKQDAFGWLDFTPTRYWRLLAWMDPVNYHGLAYAAPEAASGVTDESASEVTDEPASEVTVSLMHWAIADYLPPAVQELFKRVAQEFVVRASAPALPEPAGLEAAPEAGPQRKPAGADGPDEEGECEDSDFAQLFLTVLRTAQKYFHSVATASDVHSRCFPDLLGSRLAAAYGSTHPNPRAAMLEFVKACKALFTLDAAERPRQAEHLMKLACGLLGTWRVHPASLLMAS